MARKWWTLIAVSVATFMLLLDITVVNVALPSIREDLGATYLARHAATEVGAHHDVGVERGEERVEVTLARCRKERIDDLALALEVRVRRRALALEPSPRAARELPRRLR